MQSVYKNDAGDVMFGNSGNVFKVPYSFGKAFGSDSSTSYSNYIIFPFEINSDFTFLLWCGRNNISSGTQYAFRINFDDGNYLNQQFRPDTVNFLGNLFYNKSLIGGGINVFTSLTSPKSYGLFCITYNRTTGEIKCLNLNQLASLPRHAGLNVSNIILPTTSIGPYVSYNSVYLCDRILSLDEILYIKNNFLGSEPRALQDFKLFCKNGSAEILNNGDSDFVGVRNEIEGQLHGKIMNLPAGTLQEQLDYANANLFVNFID